MVVCLILSTFSSLYSQVIDSKQYNYVGNWYNWQGGRFITNLNIPKVQATSGRDTGAIRYALADSSIYVWTGSQWRQVAGGAGAVSSVFGRTGAVTALEADYNAFYPLLTGTYNNPSWLNQLAWSKITGTPSFLTYHLINGGANIAGSGIGIFKDTSSNKLNFKRLKAGWRTTVTDATDSVIISVDTTTQTLTDGVTITFNASLGTSAQVTLGGNRTLAFSNFSAGVYLTLVVIQDGTGSRTLTLPTCKVINGGAGAVTLTTAASSQDILTFFKIGTTIYCNYGKNYN